MRSCRWIGWWKCSRRSWPGIEPGFTHCLDYEAARTSSHNGFVATSEFIIRKVWGAPSPLAPFAAPRQQLGHGGITGGGEPPATRPCPSLIVTDQTQRP